MKYALLRGLLVGMIAALGGVLVTEALMLVNGGPRMQYAFEFDFIVAAQFGAFARRRAGRPQSG